MYIGIAKNSLYRKPQYTDMKPMSRRMYLSGRASSIHVPLIYLLKSTKIAEKIKMIEPCPTSPNIMPKRNGKVTMLTTAGFAS
jgi:hypothetical protein